MRNGLNVKNLVRDALADISPRQKKVLEGRFGFNSKALTLAEIGQGYGLTRERVRQIEKACLESIKPRFNDGELAKFVQVVSNNLKQYKGVRNEAMLLADLGCSDSEVASVKFLIEASGKFNYRSQDNDYNSHWYADDNSNKEAVNFINKLHNYLKNNRDAQYKPKDETEVNYISISRQFSYSPYGDFGLVDWSEVCPQNARDWAYLVLKNAKRPMHFNELAAHIDKVKKSSRKTNAQTVHNELIKDDRFVLVGRGTYGLREFGILPGTAKEVIAYFLKKHGPLKSQEVVKMVIQERVFKENTLLLNLQNRKHFQRLEDGRYTIKEA